jgi:SAM-dependent methyltransferase
VTFDQIFLEAQRRNVSVEVLAALGAKLGGRPVHPSVEPLLDNVLAAMGADLGALDPGQRMALAGMIRAFFRQAADLLEQPDRAPGWVFDDPALLQSQGRASMSIVPVMPQLASTLGDLADRLGRPGGTFLDVGTGVALISVAMARALPNLLATGIDIWKPALDLARVNIADLADRISIREQNVVDLRDEDAFDLVFLPGPFLPAAIVPEALARCLAALRPGGWLLFGLYAAAPDPVAAAVNDLRIVRSGGHPWTQGEAAVLLDQAGFADVRTPDRTWSAPMNFVAGTRAG